MAKSFHTSIATKGGRLWVVFKDQIDMDNYKQIEESISIHFNKGENKDIVVDLQETRTLFSPGIGLLMRLHGMATANQGKLFLVNVSDKLREVLTFSSLDKVLGIFTTAEEFENKHSNLT